MNPEFQKIILGNSVADYLGSLLILLCGFLLSRYAAKWLSFLAFKIFPRQKIEHVGFDSFLKLLKKPFTVFLAFITVFLAFQHLDFPAEWKLAPVEKFGFRMVIEKTFLVALSVSTCWIFMRIVDYVGLILLEKAKLTESKADDQIVPFLKEGLKVLVVIFFFFFILGAIFGLDITSLVAGLGIGGLAIALAAKESLENLLGSFTIFFDKPFQVGDLIKIGNTEGHIERIGFRSTRIRTLDKSFVTVPNKKLVDSELDNLSLREQRRVRFFIQLTYDTPSVALKKLMDDIRSYLLSRIETTDDCFVHFYEFGTYSLNIRIIYFINSNDWDVYSAVREDVNFHIMKLVESAQLNFAFPTSTIISGNSGNFTSREDNLT
jgi:MscS family membrane protein